MLRDNLNPTAQKVAEEIEQEENEMYATVVVALTLAYRGFLKSTKQKAYDYFKAIEGQPSYRKSEAEKTFNKIGALSWTLKEPYNDIKATIEDYKRRSAEFGYYSAFYRAESMTKKDFGTLRVNKAFLEALVENPVAGSSLSQRLYKNKEKLAKEATNALTRMGLLGWSYEDTAQNIALWTEADFSKALRIARTEGGRCRTLATQKGYEDAKALGADIQKMWLAALDKKTRMEHIELDGQIVDIDEPFKYNGLKAIGPRCFGVAGMDINCRCTTIVIVDGIIPSFRRDNETGAIVPVRTYKEWAKYKQDNSVFEPVKQRDAKGNLTGEYASLKKQSDHLLHQGVIDKVWGGQLYKDANTNPVWMYTKGHNELINNALQGIYAGGYRYNREIAFIDDRIAGFNLARNTVVYRADETKWYAGYKVGDRVSLDRYTSTTISKSAEARFFKKYNKDLHIEIRVPKGTQSLYIGEYSDRKWEEELLLKYGQRAKIVEWTGNKMVLEILK
jgi:hypothetical protein